MDKAEQLEFGVETVNWIQNAGKESRERMYADSVLKENADQKVNIYYVGALTNKLANHDAEVIVNDLHTLIRDERKSLPDERWLHPLQEMTIGEATAVVAMGDDEKFSNWSVTHSNPAIRLAAAAVSRSPEILDFLSYDPCVLVRTAVAVSDFTSSETKNRLRQDPFWHVQRRTYYGDAKAIAEFDNKRKMIDSEEIEPDEPEFWPGDCACVDVEFAYEDFNERFQVEEELFVPNLPEGLSEKMRKFDNWYWGTQPFPDPKTDYLIYSVDYLKNKIPDQYALNHWGHGMNSYGLNLRIAIGDLAIMAQVAWFGVFNESQKCREAWDDMARQIDELIQGKPRIYSEEFRQRDYLIVFSDFRLTYPELWVRNGSAWEKNESVSSLSDIAKIVNK